MKAGKAYISSLGTTGLLIASSLLLLVVVGTLVAFDGWPATGSANDPETVAIGTTKRVRAKHVPTSPRKAATSPRRTERSKARRERQAARKRRPVASPTAQGDGGRVISDLPAPGTGGSGSKGGGSAPAPAPAPASSGLGSTAASGGSQTTHQLGESVSTVNPGVGQAIQQTGDTVAGTVQGIADPVLPVVGIQQQTLP